VSQLSERLERVTGRIAAACARAGRDPGGVQLVAVTKTWGPDEVREAYDAGLRVMGESRMQEARQKVALCPSDVEWHMVGHLQSNKCRDAVQCFKRIHSVDSLNLLEKLDDACERTGVEIPVCLEVNVSGERSKFGLAPEAVPAVLEKSRSLMRVSVTGLMTVPPFFEEAEQVRPFFRSLRVLRDRWAEETGIMLADLSMGMSHDFEVAIEEGATLIRLGTVLFGGRAARKQRMAAGGTHEEGE